MTVMVVWMLLDGLTSTKECQKLTEYHAAAVAVRHRLGRICLNCLLMSTVVCMPA